MFSIDFHPLVWVLLPLGIILAWIYLWLVPRRWRRLAAEATTQTGEPDGSAEADNEVSDTESGMPEEDEGATPQQPCQGRASVVAYCQGSEESVAQFLDAVSRQDYPDFEVIIVLEGTPRQAASLTDIFDTRYPWARFTFVPPESRNLSRRKLANTMGIKSATGEVIVTTRTNILPPHPQWISRLMAHFADPAVDVVTGYAAMDWTELHGLKGAYRAFDSLTTAARWMVFVAHDRPYRGDGANLAFRRELFFRHGGYGKNYFLHSGDDDIFVSQIATSRNTRLEIARQAQIFTVWGDAAPRIWIDQKERYWFTGRFLRRAPRIEALLNNWVNWLAFGSLLGAAIVPLPNLLPLCVAIPAIALLWIFQARGYQPLWRAFSDRHLSLLVPLFLLLQPWANIIFRIRYRSRHPKNFTWVR